MSGKHLKNCLRIVTTSIDPDIDSLFSQEKQFQISQLFYLNLVRSFFNKCIFCFIITIDINI